MTVEFGHALAAAEAGLEHVTGLGLVLVPAVVAAAAAAAAAAAVVVAAAAAAVGFERAAAAVE